MTLSRSQIESLIGKTTLSHDGRNLYGKCVWCGGDEFGISLEGNNPFNCFRKKNCGITGTSYTLLAYLKRTKEFLGNQTLQQTLSTFEEEQTKEETELPEITPPIGWKRQMDDPYLRQRGFVDYQFEKYKVGRSILSKEYVTVLVEMCDRTVAYLSRSIRSKEQIDRINIKRKEKGEKKYLRYNNSHSDFSKMLFGYDEIVEGKTTDVILVEGWLSKTKTDVNLHLDSDDWLKCVATFGAKVSGDQIELLRKKKVKNIWLWFEADVLDKVKLVSMRLNNYFYVRVGYLHGKDPNEWDEQETIEFFDKCVSPIELNMNYL